MRVNFRCFGGVCDYFLLLIAFDSLRFVFCSTLDLPVNIECTLQVGNT